MRITEKLIAAVTLVFALSGCGSGASPSAAAYDTSSNEYFGVAESAAVYDAGEAYYEYEEASDSPEEALTGDKLVYTGSLNIETLSYEETVSAVRERINAYHGIIEQENAWDNDRSWVYTDGRERSNNRSLSMTVRIPTASFDAFMNDMDGTGKITSRSQGVDNISRRYNDNSIEIEAVEKQQARLLEMMDAAETVEEMILVEERLSEVQTRLNQKKSYRSSMDTDVEYSTIYLNINEVQKYTPVDNRLHIDGFWEKVTETFTYSWTFFVYFLEELTLVLIHLFPFLLVGGLLIYGIRKYRKSKGLDPRIFHRNKEKKERRFFHRKKKGEEETETSQPK